MKLVISTLALALGGGAALWAPLAAAPCDPQEPTTAPQCTEESQVVEVEPASFALLPGLSQEPDAEARRELEQARREIERALAQAERERAELEKELAREMEHVQREVQRAQVEGQREAERAMREAQRARQEGQREAQRALLEAQRVAEHVHREAQQVHEEVLREAEQARREAMRAREEALREATQVREEFLREAQREREEVLRMAAEARGGLVVAQGRSRTSGQERSARERRLEERIALLERELARAHRAPPAAQAGRGSAPQPAAPLARRLTIRRGDASGGIVQREPSARSAPQPDSAPNPLFGLGAVPAPPAVPGHPAHPGEPVHPVHPAPPAPSAGAGAGHGSGAPAHRAGCCCCCCCCGGGHGGHEGQESGEVGFLFATPNVEIGRLADVSFDDEGEWAVAWEQQAEEFEEQMAELEAELAELELFELQLPEMGALGVGDELIEWQACSGCEGGDCDACGSGDCEAEGELLEECEESELLEELEWLEEPEGEVSEESPLRLERLHPPTQGAPDATPTVVRFDSVPSASDLRSTLWVPTTGLAPAAVEPLASEVAELVEEMRSEVQSLREVLRALREEIRSGGFEQQL